MSTVSIAIDGPSGAGKSTIAKIVSKEIGFVYIDTGAMYRAVALKCVRAGIDTTNQILVEQAVSDISITISYDENGQKIYLDNEDVTDQIRTPEVSLAASHVAVVPAVRLKLVELQRKLTKTQNVIMDGRDIGTYVLPNSKIKIFLTAAVEDRAQRRYSELLEKNREITYEDVKKDIEFRDANDSSRAFAPLKAAEDAILIDTSGFTLEKSVALIKSIIEENL